MSRGANGYSVIPAVLAGAAFALPLIGQAAQWLGLPRELGLAAPLLLGIAGLAWRHRAAAAEAIVAEPAEGEAQSVEREIAPASSGSG